MPSFLEKILKPTLTPPPNNYTYAQGFLKAYRELAQVPFTISAEPRVAMDIHARLNRREIAKLIMQGLLSPDFPLP